MSSKRRVSQEAFLALVKENMEEFDMNEEEAIEDAKMTLLAQGVDISGIVISSNEESEIQIHPLILVNQTLSKSIERFISSSNHSLKTLDLHSSKLTSSSSPLPSSEEQSIPTSSDAKAELFSSLQSLLTTYRSMEEEERRKLSFDEENTSIEFLITVFDLLESSECLILDLALECLTFLIKDQSNRETFFKSNGPHHLIKIFDQRMDSSATCQLACGVMSLAGKKYELAKVSFMDLSVPDLLLQALYCHVLPSDVALPDTSDSSSDLILNGSRSAPQAEDVIDVANPAGADVANSTGADVAMSVCKVIQMLCTSDDMNATASNTFRFARFLSEKKFTETIFKIVQIYENFTNLVSEICITLKTLAVNDEICQNMSNSNGAFQILKFLKISIQNSNKEMAMASLSLIKQLSKSDKTKAMFAKEGAIGIIVSSIHRFHPFPTVLQQSFAAMAALSLRSPESVKVAMEADIMQITIAVMNSHNGDSPMLQQTCAMLRNFASRSPEYRLFMLEQGAEGLLRKIKKEHPACREMASFALRDLGVDNYLN